MDHDPRTIDWSEQQFEEVRPGVGDEPVVSLNVFTHRDAPPRV
jgi:hypothetical protein